MKEIFPEISVDLDNTPVHNQCLWAAESYIRIQEKTGLTFEAIFLYIPIDKSWNIGNNIFTMNVYEITE